jgi:hypothetical protein
LFKFCKLILILSQRLRFKIFIEQYEAAFKSIFNELDKYTWNIECVSYVMDQLHLHLKELLDTISQIHSYQQSQFTIQLNALKQQQQSQTNKEPLISQSNGLVNTGLASTASIGTGVTSALLVSTSIQTGATLVSGNPSSYASNSNVSTPTPYQQQSSFINTLNSTVQQQNHDSQLIFKLQELICTLMQVSHEFFFQSIWF